MVSTACQLSAIANFPLRPLSHRFLQSTSPGADTRVKVHCEPLPGKMEMEGNERKGEGWKSKG
eukprot:750908-Hanusia_phi.AAC.2